MSRISVGYDGILWGIDSKQNLRVQLKSGNWKIKSPISVDYVDLDVLNAEKLIAVDRKGNLYLVEVSGYPDIPKPVETPFNLVAYSAGWSGSYKSSREASKKPIEGYNWPTKTTPMVELEVNFQEVLGRKDGKLPGTGINLVALDPNGRSVDLSKMVQNSDIFKNIASGDHHIFDFARKIWMMK